MAEFCYQCAKELGFEPDFDGLTTEADTAKGLFAVVLCETCGPTLVDHTGKCVSPYCFEKHGKLPETDPVKGNQSDGPIPI